MHFIFTFIPLLLAFASAKAAPADLAERQSCPEGDGKRHYVILKPGEWTNVNSLDKNEFDSWTYLGGYQQSPPWYFSPNPPDGSRPYTVEHFNLWTYVREDRGWYATSQDTEHRKVAHKYDCHVWAPYGVSPGCVTIRTADEASGEPVITGPQADVTTECIRLT